MINSGIVIRQLFELQEQLAARLVFDHTWAMDAGTEITPNLLQAMVHSGAYLSGAFIGNECVGAAFAFPATTGGLHLHSHMTAVVEKYRDRGVGYLLKIDQWQWAKKNNYKEITWTFDPLVRRNAKLNLLKLGADIASYHPNFYGDMPDALNAGDESDRVLASWKVIGDKPVSRNEIVEPLASDILIAIPEDIVAIREKDLSENLKWRHQVRDQFVDAFAKGGQVIGFSANSEYVVRI
jgi:predicted GNAT superfamily acetyltransferase